MYKIGLSTCGKVIDGGLFRDCAESGISVLEISPGQGRYDELNYGELSRLSREYGIGLWSLHLPFCPFERIDISSPDAVLRKSTIEYMSEIIKKAAGIGINKFVVHGSGEPIASPDRAAHMSAAKESLAELAEIAERNGGIIALEDLPRTCLGNCSAEINELASVDSRIRVCFDTNHLLGESAVDFIRSVGKKIVTLHVSDYDFLNERHWLPGEGKQDWKSLFDALTEAGYGGVWLYEVEFKAPGTIMRGRDLSCADFVNNAKEIFSGISPTPVGTPAEGLKGWK